MGSLGLSRLDDLRRLDRGLPLGERGLEPSDLRLRPAATRWAGKAMYHLLKKREFSSKKAMRNENQGQQTPQKRLKMSACYSDTHTRGFRLINLAYASNSSLPSSPQFDPVHTQHSCV